MKAWDTSCVDWERRIMAGLPLVPNLPIKGAMKDEAEKALRCIKRLKLPDVIGRPTMGDASGDWFFRIVWALFGSYDIETNRRMIQELFLLVPKKNAKSTGAAAIMVTAAIINRRPEAEYTLVAPTIEVAQISFKQARGIIQADPMLERMFQVRDHIKTIQHRTTGAYLQIKAADTDTITGSKSTGTLIDETHVFAKRGNAADIFVELRGALAARTDGFVIQITTQSKDPPSGVFKQELNSARDVRDGKIKLPLLPVLYELPLDVAKDGGWKKKACWHLVNPNLGRSVDEQFLTRELAKAERASPAALALFASQHFNVEIGQGLRSDSWVGAEYWQACKDRFITLDSIIERSDRIAVGIDGGGLDDLLGFAAIGRDRQTGDWLGYFHAWAHKVVLSRRQDIAGNLKDFISSGDVTLVENVGDDVQDICDIVERLEQEGKLFEKITIGVDQMGISEIVEELAARNIEPARIGGVPQGWKLNNAIKTVERRLASRTFKHSGSELMAWCLGNAKAEAKGNAVAISKQASGSAKIDPLMALFDAVVVLGLNPENATSIYEERPLMVL